ncbi:hypothetical protein KTF24_24185, partial [Burkholderia multivorans]|uniref:hypothetical protein n=1 Tax=Burkholderia multivorans TaxID=87883 RepID=UPI001C245636
PTISALSPPDLALGFRDLRIFYAISHAGLCFEGKRSPASRTIEYVPHGPIPKKSAAGPRPQRFFVSAHLARDRRRR